MADPLRTGRRGPIRARSARLTWTSRLLAGVVATLALLLVGSGAGAHSGIQSYVYISLSDSEVDGRVEYPVADLSEVLGIEFPTELDGILEVALDNADTIRAYTAEHLAMGDESGPWELSFTEDLTVIGAQGGYIQVPYSVERSFDDAPRSFQVDYDGIIHANPERDALFLVENDWGTARFNNEGDHLLGFSVGLTSQDIELEDVGVLSSVDAARALGSDVLRDRADLMFFVVATLLPVALVALGSNASGAAPGIASASRRALKLIGVVILATAVVILVVGITAADVSDDLARALVAVSVILAAAFAVWRFTQRETLVVAALGAVHGIGYADEYLALQLDRVDNPLTLVGYVVGVALSILVLAVVVFPLLLVLRRVNAAPTPLYAAAGVMTLYALVWLIEAATVIGLASNRYTTPIEVWPRNIILVLLAWIPAVAWHAWAAGRDALRPVEGEQPASEIERSVVAS